MKKIYIGIDPDLRLLNAAIVGIETRPSGVGCFDHAIPLAVFARRNKEGVDNTAVVGAARTACRLVEDVIAWLVANGTDELTEIVSVVESQNIQHALKSREQGRQKIVPDDIRRLAQVAGCLMGAFSNLSTSMVLVQAQEWKGEVPKGIHHKRIYSKLGIEICPESKVRHIFPLCYQTRYCQMSGDKINPGDFADINDSLGLAVWAAEKRL
jgi:hypothetical protein